MYHRIIDTNHSRSANIQELQVITAYQLSLLFYINTQPLGSVNVPIDSFKTTAFYELNPI